MNKKSLKLSSIILFYLLAFLALTIIVDAHGNHGKCKTTTTTTTTTITKTSSTCKATPTLKLKRDKRGHGHGHGHGHGDGDGDDDGHCTKTATCTHTKFACVTPPPTCILDGKPCTGGAQNCCGKVCCDDGLCAGVGSTCTPQ
ncbi:unnamed protein product [Rhizophagus irregularis]|uniref:Uncharacterized protein n=1 Tax=Rhizophagus irregularis TaxID=588596 RepID=A0A2I1FE94_9GLOM|nr:hypothetical protein RhiirB3_451036 [Rhizophagus irregularis]CAB5091595.1 unnamed protein product [Rhizophagus irregularis]CAB5392023.1 unnamed protein product [Rhizophagus irregularis]